MKKRTGEEGRNGEEEGQMDILSTLMPLSWAAAIGILKMQLLLSMTAAFGNFKIPIVVVHDSDICHIAILRVLNALL